MHPGVVAGHAYGRVRMAQSSSRKTRLRTMARGGHQRGNGRGGGGGGPAASLVKPSFFEDPWAPLSRPEDPQPRRLVRSAPADTQLALAPGGAFAMSRPLAEASGRMQHMLTQPMDERTEQEVARIVEQVRAAHRTGRAERPRIHPRSPVPLSLVVSLPPGLGGNRARDAQRCVECADWRGGGRQRLRERRRWRRRCRRWRVAGRRRDAGGCASWRRAGRYCACHACACAIQTSARAPAASGRAMTALGARIAQCVSIV